MFEFFKPLKKITKVIKKIKIKINGINLDFLSFFKKT